MVLDLDARHSPESADFNCTELWNNEPKCNVGATNYYCILIENPEGRKVNYMVQTTGDNGTEVCSPDNIVLESYQSKAFAVGYDKAVVGLPPISAEVEAVLFLE